MIHEGFQGLVPWCLRRGRGEKEQCSTQGFKEKSPPSNALHRYFSNGNQRLWFRNKIQGFYRLKAKQVIKKIIVAGRKVEEKSPTLYIGSHILVIHTYSILWERTIHSLTLVFEFPVNLELVGISKGLKCVINIVSHEYYMSSDMGSLCWNTWLLELLVMCRVLQAKGKTFTHSTACNITVNIFSSSFKIFTICKIIFRWSWQTCCDHQQN